MNNRRFTNIPSFSRFFLQCFIWARLAVICNIAFAQENAISSISAEQQGSNVAVTITLKVPLDAPPTEKFADDIKSGAALILDFGNVANETGSIKQQLGSDLVFESYLARKDGRTLLLLGLTQKAAHRITLSGRVVTVLFRDDSGAPPVITSIENKPVNSGIHVKGISTRSLAFLLASEARMDIVIGDQLSRERISVDEPTIDAITMIRRLAEGQNLGLRIENNMLMVASKCRLSNPQSLYRSNKGQQKVSFNFEDIRASAIASADGILTAEDQAPYSTSDVISNATISIGLRDRTIREIVDTMSTVMGWKPQPYIETGVQFIPGEEAAECASHAKPAEASGITTAKIGWLDNHRSCPHHFPGEKPCEPLEKYQWNELKPLGYIQWQGQSTRHAVLETSDGLVFETQVGHFIGPNLGQIKSISDNSSVRLKLEQNQLFSA